MQHIRAIPIVHDGFGFPLFADVVIAQMKGGFQSASSPSYTMSSCHNVLKFYLGQNERFVLRLKLPVQKWELPRRSDSLCSAWEQLSKAECSFQPLCLQQFSLRIRSTSFWNFGHSPQIQSDLEWRYFPRLPYTYNVKFLDFCQLFFSYEPVVILSLHEQTVGPQRSPVFQVDSFEIGFSVRKSLSFFMMMSSWFDGRQKWHQIAWIRIEWIWQKIFIFESGTKLKNG